MASLPMRFPATRFPEAVSPTIETPTRSPETTCDPLAFPWIVSAPAFWTRIPLRALPRSIAPFKSVPIRLPTTRLPVSEMPA